MEAVLFSGMDSILVNGEEVKITAQYGGKIFDGNILMYNDALYIPIQMVAQMLGYDIAWLQTGA